MDREKNIRKPLLDFICILIKRRLLADLCSKYQDTWMLVFCRCKYCIEASELNLHTIFFYFRFCMFLNEPGVKNDNDMNTVNTQPHTHTLYISREMRHTS